MKKPLLEVMLASEKRKNVLLHLKDGPRKMEYLLRSLETTRTALLPQMRILEEHYLVTHDKDIYELTTVGKIITDEMTPLLDITNVLDVDVEYWGTHKLEFIPPYLMERISELENCTVIKPKLPELYTLPPQIYGAYNQFQDTPDTSGSFTGVSTFFYPNSYEVFSSMLQSHVKVNIIITKDLFEKIRSPEHTKIEELLKNKLYDLYVYPKELGFISFAFDDHHLLMRLLNSNGSYDANYILCSSPSALRWGKELFEHYLKDSTQITEL